MKHSEDIAAVDAYIADFPADVQKVLQKVRQTIRKATPMAKERISYKMPTFFLDRDIAYFGAFKEHIGLYPPVRVPELQARIAPYRGEKGNLRFPLDKPIPYDLIAAIVKSRLQSQSARSRHSLPSRGRAKIKRTRTTR